MAGAAAEAQVDGLGEVQHHREEALAFDVSRTAAHLHELTQQRAVAYGAVATAVLGGIECLVGGA